MTLDSQKTTCAYCGVGCGVAIPKPNDRTIAVSGDTTHPANSGKLCVKGTHLGDVLPVRNRLLTPNVNGEDVPWSTAINSIADKIKQSIQLHGSDSVGFYLSGQLLTEDYYAANKLAKGFLGTANVDTNSRLCMSSAVAAHVRAFGEDAVPGCYDDIELADLVIITGSNLAWGHPILFQRLIASREKNPNKKIVVIDPRKSATAEEADLHLAIKPGADGILFNGLLVALYNQDALDKTYIENHTDNFEPALESAFQQAGTDLQKLADNCDVDSSDLKTLVNWLVKYEKTTTIWSMGINQSESGVDKGNAIINLHLATGRIGKPGATPFSITGQPNAMGGREVGGLANQLAIHRGFTPEDIKAVGNFWQSNNMAHQPGLKAIDLFDACKAGKIKVLWIMATNPVASLPNANLVKEALENVETVIVSDVVDANDTLNYADIKLPALAWGEKDGIVTNSERTISRQRAFLIPPGQSKADWWQLAEVAKKLGFETQFNWQNSYDVFKEHCQLSSLNDESPLEFSLSGVQNLTSSEYDNWRPKQWPITTENQSPSRLFSEGEFATKNGRAQFIAVKPCLPTENPASSEFTLNTGRLRDQWHTMARTGMASRLSQHTDTFEIHLHPKDAEALSIKEGDLIKVSSPYGHYFAFSLFTDHQKQGEVFSPMHWNEHFAKQGGVANVIPSLVDPISGQPASKHTSVKLEKAAIQANAFLFVRDETQAPRELIQKTIVFREYSEQGVLYSLYYEAANLQTLESSLQALPGCTVLNDSEAHLLHGSVEGEQGLEFWYSASTELFEKPDKDFLNKLISNPLNETDFRSLIFGRDITQVNGKAVCTCFNVSDLDIKNFLDKHPESDLKALQAALKCGTNCGSCLTEVKSIHADFTSSTEFYEAV